jgi:surfactin synthase thioesterase subunit
VLGIPVTQIGRRDHFFDRGGTSLSAVKLAIAVDRAVSLKDVTRYPVLCDLAAMVDGKTARRQGLLQALTEPVEPAEPAEPAELTAPGEALAPALVCFPYAGGNAVNFQSLASALRGSGLAVYAVELPGHDLAADSEPYAPLTQVVDQAVAEINQHGLTSVMLWGHSSGTAFAVAAAMRLQELGVTVRRVFLAAQLPGDPGQRRAAISELMDHNSAEIAATLIADSGFTGLADLDAQRAEHLGAAYRHDCVSAHRYLADSMENPPATRLAAPVTVVVAADDPNTTGFGEQYRDWKILAEQVDLYELSDGGHYFLRTRPVETAQAVLSAAELLASHVDA